MGNAAIAVTPSVLRELALPGAEDSTHKGMRGRVLVVAGAAETPGAALLAGIAALRGGAGVLQVATARSVARQLAVAVPEARVIGLDETPDGDISGDNHERVRELAAGADAVLIGPGLMDADALTTLVGALLAPGLECRVAVDARALEAVSGELARTRGDDIVLAPNAKEAAHMLGISATDVESDLAAALRELVARFGCTVALRAGDTVVGGPDGALYHEDGGTPGLGASGSGDVVTGFLAGLLARGTPAVAAAVWAVHVHALAGRRLGARIGPLGYLARELLDELTPVMSELDA